MQVVGSPLFVMSTLVRACRRYQYDTVADVVARFLSRSVEHLQGIARNALLYGVPNEQACINQLLSRPAVCTLWACAYECVMLLYVMDMTNSFVVMLSSMCLERWTDVARRVTYLLMPRPFFTRPTLIPQSTT